MEPRRRCRIRSTIGSARSASLSRPWPGAQAGFFTRLVPLDAWTILFWRGVFAGSFTAAYVVWRYRGETLRVYRSMGRPGWLFALCSAVGMTAFIRP
jgi:hypothetical protein